MIKIKLFPVASVVNLQY